TFQAATNADYFAVGIIGIVGIVCLLAFMITGIFYHPVREWLRHGKNDNVVPYDWRMIRLYSYVLIGFPLIVYIVGGLAGRSATLLPPEIEYHSMFEKDPRLLLDDEKATIWQTELPKDGIEPPLVKYIFEEPVNIQSVILNGSLESDDWQSHNRVKEIQL